MNWPATMGTGTSPNTVPERMKFSLGRSKKKQHGLGLVRDFGTTTTTTTTSRASCDDCKASIHHILKHIIESTSLLIHSHKMSFSDFAGPSSSSARRSTTAAAPRVPTMGGTDSAANSSKTLTTISDALLQYQVRFFFVMSIKLVHIHCRTWSDTNVRSCIQKTLNSVTLIFWKK